MRIFVKNLPDRTRKNELEAFFNKKGDITDVYMLVNSKGKFRRVAFIGYQTDAQAAEAKNYFDGAMFNNHKIAVDFAKEEKIEAQNPSESQERRILYSKTIFVKKLSVNTDADLLRAEFEKIGKVMDFKMENREDKWFAVIKFREGAHAVAAFKRVKILLGMRVKICAYDESPVVKQKEYYNTLFFNFETVIKRTCEAEKLSKRDLIDLKDPRLGSRVSRLETELVEQTKRFLEQNNIYLDFVTDKMSQNTLILRNSDLFAALDLIQGEYKVSIAPSKCLGLLEFNDSKDAFTACKNLNLRTYRNKIVYCEFAPVCSVPVVPKDPQENLKVFAGKKTNKLIVKNVPFQATVDDLKNVFSAFAHVVDVRLPIKTDKQHRGFGFLILDSSESLEKVIDYFGSSTHLFGRRLVLEKAKI